MRLSIYVYDCIDRWLHNVCVVSILVWFRSGCPPTKYYANHDSNLLYVRFRVIQMLEWVLLLNVDAKAGPCFP